MCVCVLVCVIISGKSIITETLSQTYGVPVLPPVPWLLLRLLICPGGAGGGAVAASLPEASDLEVISGALSLAGVQPADIQRPWGNMGPGGGGSERFIPGEVTSTRTRLSC